MIYKPPYGVAEGGNWWPGESIYAREARELVFDERLSDQDQLLSEWESLTQAERNQLVCRLEYPKMLKRVVSLNKRYECFADPEALPF